MRKSRDWVSDEWAVVMMCLVFITMHICEHSCCTRLIQGVLFWNSTELSEVSALSFYSFISLCLPKLSCFYKSFTECSLYQYIRYLVWNIIIWDQHAHNRNTSCGTFWCSSFLFLETTKFYMTEIIILPSERNFPIIPRYK